MRSAPSRWTRCRRRIPAIPARRWAWRKCAVVLWDRHLRTTPANPAWADRDRFVLSNGHGSMLLYALLHLTGYDLPMDELKRFRQLGIKTPGHPSTASRPASRPLPGRSARASPTRSAWQSPRRCWRRNSTARAMTRRSPTPMLPRRRLHDGRRFARGLRARRDAGAGQADRLLRRQRHFDRLGEGLDQAVVHRRCAPSLRGLRLAGARVRATTPSCGIVTP